MYCPELTEHRARPVQVSTISEIALHKLQPHPQRRHRLCSDQQDEDLLASIAEHDVQEPILMNMTRTILDGHARYQAAMELGLQSIPARVVWNLSSREEYLVALHGPDCPELRHTGLWDLLESLRPAPCVPSAAAPDAPFQDDGVREDLAAKDSQADTGVQKEAACRRPVEGQPESAGPTADVARICVVPLTLAPDMCRPARQAARSPWKRSWRISSQRPCAFVSARRARYLGLAAAEGEAHWSVVHPQKTLI